MIFNIIVIRGVWCLCQETSPSSFRCGGRGKQPTTFGHQSDRSNETF